ncbi:MAG TPA: ABC transporter substrate-binding protein [Actinomycetota bacterium]
MRRAGRFDRRIVLCVVLGLIGTACTIQAPRIVLQGSGGGEAVPGVVATGSTDGTTVAGTKIGGGSIGGGGSGPIVADDSCKGKATDVGITATSIKLGSTFAISGPVSNISGPILKGVQAYLNEVNANGGVNGRKIEFKYYDDGWDAQRGKSKIKQLVEQDKVFMLVSVPSSNGLDAASGYLDQKKVPVLGTSGLIETQFKAHMQWPVGTSSRSAARIGLISATQRLQAKTFGIVWLDLLAGYEARDAILDAAKRGFQGLNEKSIVADRRISISEPSFESVWNDVQNQARKNGVASGRPDYIVLAIDPTNAIKAMQAAERLGFRPAKGWGGAAPLFLDLVLRDAPYAVKTGLEAGTAFFPPVGQFANQPAVKKYVQVVRKYFADVDLNNPYLQGGYTGAALAVDVLEKVGTCVTRDRVIQVANSLTNHSPAGLTNPMTFRPIGVGPAHYGNTYGLVVQAVPNGTAGCTRSIGCWNVVPASGSDPFYKDPTPGR